MASSHEDSYDESDDLDDYYDEEYDEDKYTRKMMYQRQNENPEERARQIYCAICAGKHSESNCPNKQYQRSYQFNAVRENFARATSFKQVGDYYDHRKDDRGG